MNATENDLQKRLLHIIRVGLVEIRNLALAAGHDQIADLADALEIFPGIVDRGETPDRELVRSMLKTYQDKYQSNYQLARRFEDFELPERF